MITQILRTSKFFIFLGQKGDLNCRHEVEDANDRHHEEVNPRPISSMPRIVTCQFHHVGKLSILKEVGISRFFNRCLFYDDLSRRVYPWVYHSAVSFGVYVTNNQGKLFQNVSYCSKHVNKRWQSSTFAG